MKARKYTKETIADIGIRDRGFPQFRPGDCIEVVKRLKRAIKSVSTFSRETLSQSVSMGFLQRLPCVVLMQITLVLKEFFLSIRHSLIRLEIYSTW